MYYSVLYVMLCYIICRAGRAEQTPASSHPVCSRLVRETRNSSHYQYRLSLWGPLGDTPQTRNKTFMGPCSGPQWTNTKVISAKGHFCAPDVRCLQRPPG